LTYYCRAARSYRTGITRGPGRQNSQILLRSSRGSSPKRGNEVAGIIIVVLRDWDWGGWGDVVGLRLSLTRFSVRLEPRLQPRHPAGTYLDVSFN
jgi:hypothetical protein